MLFLLPKGTNYPLLLKYLITKHRICAIIAIKNTAKNSVFIIIFYIIVSIKAI